MVLLYTKLSYHTAIGKTFEIEGDRAMVGKFVGKSGCK